MINDLLEVNFLLFSLTPKKTRISILATLKFAYFKNPTKYSYIFSEKFYAVIYFKFVSKEINFVTFQIRVPIYFINKTSITQYTFFFSSWPV